MRNLYKLLLLVVSLATCVTVFSQNNFFTDAGSNTIRQTSGFRSIIPNTYRAATLNIEALRTFLWALPDEKNVNRRQAPILTILMPDGSISRFRVWESSIQEPALEIKFPGIKTFNGQGIDDPYATIRFDLTPRGFHAQVLTVNGQGSYYVDPYSTGTTTDYIIYFRKDMSGDQGRMICELMNSVAIPENVPEAACRGTELRTYRLAVACTGEYAQAPGINAGTNPAILHAAIVTTVNRVVGVYEKEVAVRMELVANNNLVEFLDPLTDPFNGNNNASVLINESQAVIDANIGPANYDIGHTFSTGGGGLAQLSCVCGPSKARGITGSPTPTGDPYDIDYVAHEMGHQFGGNHSMGGCGSSPNSTKYEPGSGTTIQAYAGICGAENIQPNSDPFFHAISFDEISNFLVGGGASCGVVTSTGNNIPVIDPLTNNNLSIPGSTPFTLTGTATDPDGDPLTYCWEQWDFNPSGNVPWNAGATGPTNNSYPLFKSRIPKTTGSRTFPDIAVILAGYPSNPPATMGGLKGETLSPVTRVMKFKLTVRDNQAGGGGLASSGAGGCQDNTVFQVNVVGGPPFIVTAPNGGETFPGGTSQTVTWNVSGTNVPPIDVANVRILYSTDGGQTFPTVLSASTANDGSESVTIPSGATSTARIKVEALGNIFFDISNNNFNVTVPPNGFTFTTPAPAVSACPAGTSMAITLGVVQIGTFNGPVTLSASGNPAGTTVTFSVNPVTPGNTTVVTLNGTNTLSFGSYTITVLGTSPGFPNATRDLTYTINPGTAPTITAQPTNQTVCNGSPATFSVTASGATTYQWQVSTIASPPFINIPGATTSSYTIPTATSGMTGNQYRVVVSSQCGTITSTAATLTVNTAPSISTQPANATICSGNNHTFSVTASGTSITYQWELSTDGGANYNPIGGATAASYTVNNATTGMDGYRYRVVISGVCPPTPITSNAAILTVATAPVITVQPVNATVCVPPNANTGFNITATGATNYQWQLSTNGGGVWSNVTNGGIYSGATSSSLVITGATLSMSGYQYRAGVSNATCLTPVFSNPATLTVNEKPAISGQPQSATICAGSNNTFSVTATGTGLTYQWELSTDGGGSFNPLIGATSSSYTVNNATVLMNGNQYRAVVSGACTPAVTSSPATLNVVAPPAITTQPVSNAVCETGNIDFSVVATGTTQYQWQISTNGGGSFTDIAGATSATLSLTNVLAAMDGYQYRVLLRNATCTTPVISNAATLTVNNRPTVTLSAAPYTALLPGRTTTITATLNPPSTAFNITWKRNGTVIAGATTTTYVVNVTRLGNYQVDIVDPITGCNNTSNILAIRDSASTKLFVFPSPNTGKFTVSYHNPPGTPTSQTLAIYNSKGDKVYHRKLNVNGPYELHEIDLSAAQGGVYYVVLGDPSGKVLADARVVILH